MGLFDNVGQAPQITPDVMASLGSAPMAANAPLPVPAPQAPQQPVYPGLKKPPPAIGTTINGFTYQGGDPRSKDASVWAPATGDTFLNSLPISEDKKDLIKMMTAYEAPASGNRGVGTPEVQQLVGFAKRYDPSFDIKNYKIRQDYLHDLIDSKTNITVQALGNAAKHLSSFDSEFQKLGNSDSMPEFLNAAAQGAAGLPFVGKYFGGSDRLKAAGAAKTDATIAGPEIARVAVGGQPNEPEINQQLSNLGANSWIDHGIGLKPSTEAGTIAAMAEKIGDRALTLQQQQQRAFGNSPVKTPLMAPEQADEIHKMMTKYSPGYDKKLNYGLLTGGYDPRQGKQTSAHALPDPLGLR
jgi:hypothetical protein